VVVVHAGGSVEASKAAGGDVVVGGEDTVPPPLGAPPDAAEPLPLHVVSVSGTHVNPSPQSLFTVHGRS